jgi:sec-independent protein translocase protein TatC
MARSIKQYIPNVRMPRLPEITDEPDVFEEMTLQEHLEELRDRIMKMVIAIVPTFIFGFIMSKRIIADVAQRANATSGLDVRSPTDPLTLSFKVGLYVALAITMPIIVYQLVAFLAPGMTRKEKRVLFTSLPFVTILFALGVYYGYFIAAPRALYFLSEWMPDTMQWDPDGPEVISFFMTLMIGLGLSFQLPVIMFILAKIGIAGPDLMRKYRKYAFLVLLVASAIITPSTDPYNMAIVAIPLVVLYEVGIIISSLFAKTGLRTKNSALDDVEDIEHFDDADLAQAKRNVESADDV